MHRADQFNVQDDVTLVFQSRNKNYKMELLINTGLIILDEIEGKKEVNKRIFFIDDTRLQVEEENAKNDLSATAELKNKTEIKKNKRSRNK